MFTYRRPGLYIALHPFLGFQIGLPVAPGRAGGLATLQRVDLGDPAAGLPAHLPAGATVTHPTGHDALVNRMKCLSTYLPHHSALPLRRGFL